REVVDRQAGGAPADPFRLWLPAPEPAGQACTPLRAGNVVDQPHEGPLALPEPGGLLDQTVLALDAREPPPDRHHLAVDAPADLPRQGISPGELRAERFVRPHRGKGWVEGETVHEVADRDVAQIGRASCREEE